MSKVKKIKKWTSRARSHADRAEAAAERAETALRDIAGYAVATAPGSAAGDSTPKRGAEARQAKAYTAPRGKGATTPPVADVR